MPDLYRDVIDTPRGSFTLLFSSRGLYRLYFPGREPEDRFPDRPLPWPELAADLKRYLCGEMVDWDPYPLDIAGYRPFTAALLGAVYKIPHGSVCTYREAAERAGSPLAWRAAGQALSRNRHPIIVPCHRVIASGNRAGGFSGPPGWKQFLLELENAAAGINFPGSGQEGRRR